MHSARGSTEVSEAGLCTERDVSGKRALTAPAPASPFYRAVGTRRTIDSPTTHQSADHGQPRSAPSCPHLQRRPGGQVIPPEDACDPTSWVVQARSRVQTVLIWSPRSRGREGTCCGAETPSCPEEKARSEPLLTRGWRLCRQIWEACAAPNPEALRVPSSRNPASRPPSPWHASAAQG